MWNRDRRVVMFLSDELWHCFNQLAAGLVRAGIDPVRVVTGRARRGRFTRFVEWAIYRGVIDLDAPGGLDDFRRLVASGRVVDVQVNEVLLAQLGLRSEIADLVARASGVTVDRRAGWVDKVVLAGDVGAARAAVPEWYPADRVTAEQAAERLGFPLVLKRRIGTGGRDVRIVRDHVALDRTMTEFGDDLTKLFFQAFVDGQLVGYGAVMSGPNVIAEFTAQEQKGHTNPLGPSTMVRTTDDAGFAALGRRIVGALGCEGLASLEFLADADGVLWLIDLSPRAWGCFCAFGGAGLDFVDAYVVGLGRPAAVADTRRPEPGRELRVTPAAVLDEVRVLGFGALVATLVRDLRPYVRRLGLRYCAVVTVGVLIERWPTAQPGEPDERPLMTRKS